MSQNDKLQNESELKGHGGLDQQTLNRHQPVTGQQNQQGQQGQGGETSDDSDLVGQQNNNPGQQTGQGGHGAQGV